MSDVKNGNANGSASTSRRGAGMRGGMRGGHMGGMRIESPKDLGAALLRLFGLVADRKPLLWIIALTIVITVGLSTIAPILIGHTIKENLELAQRLPEFEHDMLLILGIYLVSWLVDTISGVLINTVSMRLVTTIRQQTFARVQVLSMNTFDRRGIGDLISRMTNDVEMIYNAVSNGISSLISGFLGMIAALVAMLLLSVPLSLVVLAVVPVMVLLTGLIGTRIRGAYRKNQEWVGRLSGSIEESLSGIKVIKSFNREDAEFQSFDNLNSKARDAGFDAEFVSFAFMPLMNIIGSLTLALIIGVGGVLVLGGTAGVSVGLITSFVLLSSRFFEPLRRITQVYTSIQSAMAGTERIFELLDTPVEVKEADDARALPAVQGAVAFENVSFAYEEGKTVLDGISFSTTPGELVAIVGPTGAGKTTMINLLSRFYDVQSGRILVDGNDVRDLKLNDLRRGMGVVLQEPFFFATSIRDNLLYARHNATHDDMIAAAQTANAHYFISRLPEGYDTVLSERGENLSQGERQLLGIARAILADPRILILDEATSSVDSLTEAHIQEGLLRLMHGRTSFIIAHRLSTIRSADTVLVLHDGKIAERGTHEQLMVIPGGFYARLYGLQD